jgi:dolichol-phosphate mannosyltransferase
VGIGYSDRQRFAGQRSYTLKQTARMAVNAVLAFSSIPLRMAAVLGLVTLGVGLLYAVYILVAIVAGKHVEPGWPALIMTVLLLGGVQLLCLGVMAEYIGRIFDEVKHRPLYVVREWIGPPRDALTCETSRDDATLVRESLPAPTSAGIPSRESL